LDGQYEMIAMIAKDMLSHNGVKAAENIDLSIPAG
jgi:hypothetical protein